VHQFLETATENDTHEHVYKKPVRYVDDLKWHLIEMWKATSKASQIKRLISGDIVFNACLKAKSNLMP